MEVTAQSRALLGVVLVVLETAAVALAILVFLSSTTFQPYMWAGVGLLAGSFLLRWLATGRPARRTPLDLPLMLFVVSAAIGIWAAYDRPTAWVKFLLIVSAVAIYYLLASRAAEQWFAVLMVLGLSLFGAALAVYFVTQFDYSAQPGKFELITRLGQWINSVVPYVPGHRPHPNIVAAALEIILPLSIAAVVGMQGAAQNVSPLRALRLMLILTSLVMSFSIVMTTSRGAWLALGLVGTLAVILAWGLQRVPERLQGWVIGAALAVAVLAVTAALLAYPGDLLTRLLGSIPGGERAIGRGELYGQVLALIRDYLFTGSGLGMFPMVFSTYVLLIWVPFLTHAHNLFLQVWIEQGLLGFVAMLWLVGAFYAWAWHSHRDLSWLAVGGVLATSVLLVHGLVDVGLYSSRALPLMLVPMGLVSSQPDDRGRVTEGGQRSVVVRPRSSVDGPRSPVTLGLIVLLSVVSFLLSWNRLAALWYANLGSVVQTQVELKDYVFPERLVDYVRHDGDESTAEGYFGQALAYDPGNVTARQRLALIALGRGEHDVARAYLESAYRADAGNVVTRELLGEAYLGLGRLDEAYALCSGLPGMVTRLQGVAWVRYDRNKDSQRAGWARALAERIR